MSLSPNEFYSLTISEYNAKCQGFSEHEILSQQYSAWLTGITVGAAFGATKENPYFSSFDEFKKQLSSEEKEEDLDEKLFEIAKDKGIEIPPGILEDVEEES